MLICPICSGNSFKNIISKCMFTNNNLIRYYCFNCGVIFGPIDVLNLSKEEISRRCAWLYSLGYRDYDCTSIELDTLVNWMKAVPGKKYLNWGAGLTRTVGEAKKLNIELDEYDPGVPADKNRISLKNYEEILNNKYDGIISNNWFEHSQNPVSDLKLQLSLLNPNSSIIHRTPCYKYAYEQSPFHLFFYTGNSVDILSKSVGCNFKVLSGDMVAFYK